jgi:hypothetical protein
MSNPTSKKAFVFEPFDLPVFDVPQEEHWPAAISWDDAMREFGPLQRQYLERFDSPETRLSQKNPAPFEMRS